MHEMSTAADLYVALYRGGSERVKQPPRVLVGNESVPLAPDDRDGRLDERGLITELTMPSMDNVGERSRGNLYAYGIMAPAACVRVEVQFSPFVEVGPGKNRSFEGGKVLDKPIPLIFESNDPPRRRCRGSLVAAGRPAGANRTRRSTSGGC
jgi:hypothetical protein